MQSYSTRKAWPFSARPKNLPNKKLETSASRTNLLITRLPSTDKLWCATKTSSVRCSIKAWCLEESITLVRRFGSSRECSKRWTTIKQFTFKGEWFIRTWAITISRSRTLKGRLSWIQSTKLHSSWRQLLNWSQTKYKRRSKTFWKLEKWKKTYQAFLTD